MSFYTTANVMSFQPIETDLVPQLNCAVRQATSWTRKMLYPQIHL